MTAPRRPAPEHRLDGDYIEAGSWGVTAAITGGDIEVRGARTADLEVVAAPLVKMGLRCSYADDRLMVEPSTLTAARRITMSLGPPGGNGSTTRIGLSGHFACAASTIRSPFALLIANSSTAR